MSRTLSQFQSSQYDLFVRDAASEWNIPIDFLERSRSKLFPIFKRYLSLACAATVSGHGAARNEYSQGVVEGAYLAMMLALKGLENPSCFIVRQVIELTLKHIYYQTHSVEHGWVQRNDSYKGFGFQQLIDYLGHTNEISSASIRKAVVEPIEEWYSKLSRYVHVHSGLFIGYKTNRDRRFRKAVDRRLDTIAQISEQLWPAITSLIIIFSPDRFASASLLERRLIRAKLGASLATMIKIS
jgi:hypothetical protein